MFKFWFPKKYVLFYTTIFMVICYEVYKTNTPIKQTYEVSIIKEGKEFFLNNCCWNHPLMPPPKYSVSPIWKFWKTMKNDDKKKDKSFPHVKTDWFSTVEFICILHINPLGTMCFANTFSQSMVYPCIFLTESFEEQKYFIWMKSNLSISFLSCPRNSFLCVCVCVPYETVS